MPRIEKEVNPLFRKLLAAPEVFDAFKVPYVPAGYVRREALDRRLRDHLEARWGFRYVVVVGKRGAGKTRLVREVLRDRPRVVYVQTGVAVEDAIRGRLGLDRMFSLEDVFWPWKHDERGRDSPVLAVECFARVSPSMLRTQQREIKHMVCDDGLAYGVLVLSDPNDWCHLVDDDGCYSSYLWVGDLSLDEATAYFDARHVLPRRGDLTDEWRALRRRVVDEAGSGMEALVALGDVAANASDATFDALPEAPPRRVSAARAAERTAVETFIARAYDDASADLDALVTDVVVGADLRRFVSQLLDRGSLRSANPAFAIDFSAAATKPNASRGFRAVTYNCATGRFEFSSKAHQRAARLWLTPKVRARIRWTHLTRDHRHRLSVLLEKFQNLRQDHLARRTRVKQPTTPSRQPIRFWVERTLRGLLLRRPRFFARPEAYFP